MRGFMVLLIAGTVLAGCAANDGDDLVVAPGPEYPVDAVLAASGRWIDPVDLGEAAIHATVLADGRILFWGGLHSHGADGSPFLASPPNAESRVVDMAADPPTVTVPEPADGGASDLFCTGQTLLPDGRVLAVGGTLWKTVPETVIHGTKDVRTFDPESGTWTLHDPMSFDRWYPGVLALPDGRALVASGIGKVDDAATMVEHIEVFDPATDAMQVLPESANRDLPMYPRLFVVPSGPLAGQVWFQPAGCLWCPGGNTDGEAAWNFGASLDLHSNTWTEHGRAALGVRNAPVTVMLPLRPPEYDARILMASGTLARTGLAVPFSETMDLSTDSPMAQMTAPMAVGRWFANHVLLPDGSVIVVGGARNDGVIVPGSDANSLSPVMETERFDPEAGTWTTLAGMGIPRVYHSTALLLPDGRVWVAGSVPAQTSLPGSKRIGETAVELFEPPYLFRGPRPTIADAPDTVGYGGTFEVKAPDAQRIESVVLMRAGTVTHVYNPEQRLVELEFRAEGNRLVVDGPRDAALVPPGTWMLFVNGATESGPVPSVAAMIQVKA